MLVSIASFTVFDLETTGLNPAVGERVIEIAAVRINSSRLDEGTPFISLVNPERPVGFEATQVNGIRDEDVLNAPSIMEVLPKFLSFARGTILVAHNAQFDLRFLESEKEYCWGYVEIPECLCTMVLSRSLFPSAPHHSLTATATRLGLSLPKSRHRALPDTLLTAHVFLALLERGGLHTLEDLRRVAQPLIAWR